MPVSLKKDAQVKGGKVPPSGRYLLKTFRTTEWDYNGKQKPSTFLVVMASYKGDDEDLRKDFKDHPIYYGIGKLKDYKPNADGTNIDSPTKKEGIPDNCNAAQLLNSMWGLKVGDFAGVQKDAMPDDFLNNFDDLDGIDAEMERVDQPKRDIKKKKLGLTGDDDEEAADEDEDKDRKDTFLLVKKFYSAPWIKGKKAADEEEEPVPKKKAAAADEEEAPAKKGSVDESKALRKKCIAAIRAVMEDNPKGITKKALGKEVFSANKKEEDVKEMVEWVYDDDNLGAIPGFDYDADTAKLTPEKE